MIRWLGFAAGIALIGVIWASVIKTFLVPRATHVRFNWGPELLARQALIDNEAVLPGLYSRWTERAADILESRCAAWQPR